MKGGDGGGGRGADSSQVALEVDDIYALLSYLISSAETCTREPAYYGAYRLLDAAARLCSKVLERGLADRWLEAFREELLLRKGLLFSDRPAFFDYLQEVEGAVAAQLLARHLQIGSHSRSRGIEQ